MIRRYLARRKMRWAVRKVREIKAMDKLIRQRVAEPLYDQWCDDNPIVVRRSIMDGLVNRD